MLPFISFSSRARRGALLAVAAFGVTAAACMGTEKVTGTGTTGATPGDTSHKGGPKPDTTKCQVSCPVGTTDSVPRPAAYGSPWANMSFVQTKLSNVSWFDALNGQLALRQDSLVSFLTYAVPNGVNGQIVTNTFLISGAGKGCISFRSNGQYVTQVGQQSFGLFDQSAKQIGSSFRPSAGEDLIGCAASADLNFVYAWTRTSVFKVNTSTGVAKLLLSGGTNITKVRVAPKGNLIAVLGAENNNNPILLDSAGGRWTQPFANATGFTPADPQVDVDISSTNGLIATTGGHWTYVFSNDSVARKIQILSKFNLGATNGTAVRFATATDTMVATGTNDCTIEYLNPRQKDPHGTSATDAEPLWSQALPCHTTNKSPVIGIFFPDNSHNIATTQSGFVYWNQSDLKTSAGLSIIPRKP